MSDCSPRRQVLFLRNVYRRVSSGRIFSRKRQAFSDRGSGPQGLRRPRFSFFRFTCQTARGSRRSPLPGEPREPPKLQAADRNRRLVTPMVRSFAGAPSRRKAGGAPLWRALYEGLHGLVNTESIRFPRNFMLWTCCGAPHPIRPVADPLRRTGATFLPRCLYRGKASGHGTNQRVLELGALTRRRWRGIVLVACC